MTKSKIGALLAFVVFCVMVGAMLSQGPATSQALESADHAVNVRFEDLKWDRMVPELAERSPEMAILRVDPKTKATQLMIRVPANMHIPKHWHTANETHTVVQGTFIVECEGKRQMLGQGSWNCMPSKLPHEGWTKPDQGTLLFITVDSAWDQHWVGQAPKPSDFLGGRKD